MKTTFLYPVILLLVPACFLCAQQSATEVLDLKQAIALALANNRMVASAALNVDKSSEEWKAVHTRFFPQIKLAVLASSLLAPVDFTFEQGVFGTYPGIGPIPGEKTTITTPRQLTGLIVGSVQQPLSQLYQVKLNSNLLTVAGEEAKESERAQRLATANQVKKVYYTVVQSESNYRYAEESIKMFQELDRLTGDYVAQQVALKSDALQVKAKLAKAEYDAMVSSNDLSTHKEQLNILLGRDIRTEFEVNPVPEETNFEQDIVAAQQQALDRNPEIQKARLQLKEAEYDRRIKKSEYIPDVSFSINYLSPVNYEMVPSVIASYGFYFSWDVYDWGRKSHELAEKDQTLKQAGLALTETQNRILVDLNSHFRKVQESRKLISAAKLAQEAAQENLRVITNKYKEQSALFKDVIQAQTSLEETTDQYQQALLSFWAARADFEQSLGEDQ